MGEYGPLLSAPIIERAAERTLRTWLGAYTGEALVQAGEDRFGLPDPSDFVRVVDTNELPPESQFALALTSVAGTDGDASANPGDPGSYSAIWTLRAGVVVLMPNWTQTREAAQFYAAGTFCLAHKGLDGLSDATVRWRAEEYVEVGKAPRTMMLGLGRFWIYVPDARALYGGPDTPPDDGERPEGEPGPEVQSVRVDVDRI